MDLFETLLGRGLFAYFGAVVRYVSLRLIGKKVKFSEILGPKEDKNDIIISKQTINYYVGIAVVMLIIIIVIGYEKYFKYR